ncbi:unnamed protein product [Paramecium pentaurelia]|uniref:Uncharacterized protein n=1 Tax=Paramecium pentaurelia TaxID=43138 RepID=A0A8S1XY52_9CILI|nr:unnamed protein product [Paramecium pentaurelia]
MKIKQELSLSQISQEFIKKIKYQNPKQLLNQIAKLILMEISIKLQLIIIQFQKNHQKNVIKFQISGIIINYSNKIVTLFYSLQKLRTEIQIIWKFLIFKVIKK